MGIIAACTPTLRPGWRWLYDKIKRYNTRKGHTLLTDEIYLRPYGGGVLASGAMVNSKNSNRTTDLEPGHSSRLPLPQISKNSAGRCGRG